MKKSKKISIWSLLLICMFLIPLTSAVNEEIVSTTSFDDTTPPVTTCELEGEEYGGNYFGPVTMILTATDDESGVKSTWTFYHLDGGAGYWEQYFGPRTYLGIKEHKIEYWSTDNAGNSEPHNTIIFNIIEKFPIPSLQCTGSLSWTDVTPGDTIVGSLSVENVGEPLSLLDWEIESYPDWGTWTITPESGTELADGDTLEIGIEVIAPDDQNEEFTGEIKLVNSEEPDDFCIIQVSLVTPVSQQSLILQIFERIMERFPNAFPLLRLLLEL